MIAFDVQFIITYIGWPTNKISFSLSQKYRKSGIFGHCLSRANTHPIKQSPNKLSMLT
jgi:hypothetical protein